MDTALSVPTIDTRERIPMQVISALAQRISWGDSFLREVTQQGVILYESNIRDRLGAR
jgi:hypothetical protein